MAQAIDLGPHQIGFSQNIGLGESLARRTIGNYPAKRIAANIFVKFHIILLLPPLFRDPETEGLVENEAGLRFQR
jgi:hypothetical protein